MTKYGMTMCNAPFLNFLEERKKKFDAYKLLKLIYIFCQAKAKNTDFLTCYFSPFMRTEENF